MSYGRLISRIEQLESFPTDKLVVMISGFSELHSHGWQGLYHDQIHDLRLRGYDVLPIGLPGHSSCTTLCFSSPQKYHRSLFEMLESIYEGNAKKKFRVIAFSAAASVITHCWANNASDFFSHVLFVNPAFQFKRYLYYKLLTLQSLHLLGYLAIFSLGLWYWPLLLLLLPYWIATRLLKIEKAKIRSDVMTTILDKKPCYPLVASFLLLRMQRATRRAVTREALTPLPMLIIIGGKDPMCCYDYVMHLFVGDLRAKSVILEEAGHSILYTHWQNPELKSAWEQFFGS